jgi:hypothetical protein
MRRQDTIARRSVDLRARKGLGAEIRLGRPKRKRDGSWRCEYEVKGTPNAYSGFAAGVDSLQALELALFGLRARLALDRGTVRWLGEAAAEGIAQHVPCFLPMTFRTRIARAIEREERRLAAASSARKPTRRRRSA